MEDFTPPVSFERVVTPEWIKELLDKGFDCGMPHAMARGATHYAQGGRYDDEAVSAMIEVLQQRGQIPEHIDPYGYSEADYPVLIPPLTRFLKKRFAYVLRAMHQEVQRLGNGIRVARTIWVDEETVEAIAAGHAALGEYWSFREGAAFWHDERYGSELNMVASVNPRMVDWVTTLRRNMNFNLGDDEAEIFIASGTPLTLHKLTYHGADVPITGTHWVA